MSKVDTGGYPAPSNGHNNPPRKVAKNVSSEFPYDEGAGIVVKNGNSEGTGSLKGQPKAKQKKTTIASPKF